MFRGLAKQKIGKKIMVYAYEKNGKNLVVRLSNIWNEVIAVIFFIFAFLGIISAFIV